MSTHETADIVIAGTGYAGLSMALALARCLGPEISILAIDRGTRPTQPADDDPRAVALSASSHQLLQALGVWPALAAQAQPVRRIEITDSALDAGLRPVLLSWDGGLIGTPSQADAPTAPTAWIVPLPVLGAALARLVAETASIKVMCGAEATGLEPGPFDTSLVLADGGRLRARLAIAADGPRSALRRAAAIKVIGWSYRQLGIATTIAHDRPHEGVAVQHFLPGGPFALLPLHGQRCCVTWTEGEAEARRIMAMDDDGFLDQIDIRVGGKLGQLRLDGGRRAWPLMLQLSREYVAPRLALIGDAAHAVHPIAGQGLNLALRDVAALTEVVADAARAGLDVGDGIALERYARWRRFDATMAAATFDALNRLFSGNVKLFRSAREVGLQTVNRLDGVKQALAGEAAGLTGDLPKLLRGQLA